MTITFRKARREDVPAVVALLRDDLLGAKRETADMDVYEGAFHHMVAERGNLLVVGEFEGRVVATYQITLISGLSLRASRRAQIESVRVASELRGRGYGAALLADAEARARAGGASLMQFTSTATRDRARAFYERLGYVASHTGFKKDL